MVARKNSGESDFRDPDDPSGPKTTRPRQSERRPPGAPGPVQQRDGRTYDAVPDRVDARDWFYRPTLAPLPGVICNCDRVPAILDQGREGACTGFALAGVINFLLRSRVDDVSVSPRMLYEMARRYDEWPGEDYSGSSARGAMKGWVRHGVVSEDLWPANLVGGQHFDQFRADEARKVPGGAFFRVMHREVRDVHAAIAEVGAVYVTLMVHEGWTQPGPQISTVNYYEGGSVRTRDLPVIARSERADAAHAVILVGYTSGGFIVQNSWGEDWGAEGFALLPYEDFLLHATDVWVAQLGVPVTADLWSKGNGYTDTTAGLQRAAPVIPLADIRPYAIDVGNNGELSKTGDYWTTETDLARLFGEYLPERTRPWKRKRVMLYLHGGLNDERSVARRVIAFRDVFLANEIYPLHIMWESGGVEVIKQMLDDLTSKGDDRAGAAWLDKMRNGLLEARDWTLELTAALPGGALWREMKENAKLSSRHPKQKGGIQLLTKFTKQAIAGLSAQDRDNWELHVVGHSAGSIYGAYGMKHIVSCGIPLKSVQFMAPAMTTALFHQEMMPLVTAGSCPVPNVYALSDTGERDDQVGPYGKSLLYLVSNAFEGRRDTPLLGMSRFIRERAEDRNAAVVDREIEKLLADTLVIAGEPPDARGMVSRSNSHGGFDNDHETMNSILTHILGAGPPADKRFEGRHLQY